ncbi:hypothetical protein GCM10023403_10630 [Pseudonocardia benzenivorans]
MAWDLGDTVPLTAEIVDANGDLTAASGVVCTIGLPDGTTVTPSVSNPSTGRYTVDFVATQAGRHTERWTSTSPATARSDVFDVRDATPAYIVSLADTKQHLNMAASRTTDDEELRGWIETATEVVEDLSGQTIVRRTIVERKPMRGGKVALSSVPVVSLTAIAAVDGTLTSDGAGWDLDPETGIITALPGTTTWWGDAIFTYVAGFSLIPRRYTKAALKFIEYQWGQSQRGQVGAGRNPIGGLGQSADDDGFVYSLGYAIPRAAAELLPSRLSGIA